MAAEICAMERAGGTCQLINVVGTTVAVCSVDSQCTAGTNGRCLAPGRLAGCFCSYDTCFAGSDCKLGGPCACRGTGTVGANTCLAGNCRVDADCGPGGSCSPTYDFGCGRYLGISRSAPIWDDCPQTSGHLATPMGSVKLNTAELGLRGAAGIVDTISFDAVYETHAPTVAGA